MREKIGAQSWFLLLFLTLIWGSSYILMKKGLQVFSPIQVASWRLTVSGLACLPFLRKAVAYFPAEKYGKIFFVAMIGSGIPAFLFATAISRISSSAGGIINSLSPLFTVLTGLLFWKIHPQPIKVLGILTGFCGALLLVFGAHGFSFSGDLVFAVLPVVATFCYGLNSNFVRQHFPDSNSFLLTVLGMSMVCIPAAVVLTASGFFKTLQQPGAWLALAYISILGTFGTVLSNVMFYRLIQLSGPLFAASVTYLIPIVAIAWGIGDHENISVYHLGGLALILTGVYFVSRPAKPLTSG